MRTHSPFTQAFEQLPDSLPVFPLNGAVLLPGGYLPLNIFERRYLNMVRDAMRSEQLIGMIQPADDSAVPALQRTGCAGRIVRFEETPDGRYGIVLAGLCRFNISAELDSVRDYRVVQPDWQPFEQDYQQPGSVDSNTFNQFRQALRDFCDSRKLEVNWSDTENLGADELSSYAVSYLPLADADKQLLLEAPTLQDRLTAFLALLGDAASNSGTQH